jgi:hypothetical protein
VIETIKMSFHTLILRRVLSGLNVPILLARELASLLERARGRASSADESAYTPAPKVPAWQVPPPSLFANCGGWSPARGIGSSAMGRSLFAVLIVLFAVLVGTATAWAHGPCYCLSRNSVHPGQRVTVATNYRVTKAVWNPDPNKLANPALALLYDGKFYHRGEKTLILLRRPHPRRGAEIVLPTKLRSGSYVLALFDGTESGTHYTWQVVRVRLTDQLARTGRAVLSLIALGLCLFTTGLALLWVSQRTLLKTRSVPS